MNGIKETLGKIHVTATPLGTSHNMLILQWLCSPQH